MKCKCFGNTGTNCFTGNCNVCGLRKETVAEMSQNLFPVQPTLIAILNNLDKAVLSLDRYENSFGSGYGDCWGSMELVKDGEWVRLEDVLALFSAKKD